MSSTTQAITTIYLVRHGETIWNAEGRCQGHADSAFTDRGRAEVRELADTLAAVHFDAAYTSPLVRAVVTANAVLAGRDLRAARVPEFAELAYGDLQGSHFHEWPAAQLNAWTRDPWSVHFPGGESLSQLRERLLPAFHRVVSSHTGRTVLISAHGHVNRLLLLETHKRPREDFWHIDQPNGSVSILSCRAQV